ncbi:MAG: alginate export family protein [Myxococcales bacterium]|nr:alginate export family protein [Myxococcales bacterium]
MKASSHRTSVPYLLVACLVPSTGSAIASAEEPRPWRARDAIGIPSLHIGLEHRSRFEHIESDFRTANRGSATGVFMRTLVSAELRFEPTVVGAELMDSRAVWAADETPFNTTLVNPLELLQGYAGLRVDDVIARGDLASITAGRMTIDLGSRRSWLETSSATR